MNFSVSFLHDRKNLEGLAEECELLCVNCKLACLGMECKTLDAHHVTDIQKFFEYGVVHGLVLTWTDLVSFHIDLNTSCRILKLHERSRSHDSSGHDSSCDAYVLEISLLRIVFCLYLFRCCVYRI